ncbi:MAG: ABC transporter substrate-binding protein [Stackebrandtia sp.]
MTRLARRETFLLAAAALLPSVAGCGGGSSPPRRKKGEQITLTFWSWVPGVDKSVDLWNERNPDVQIKLSNITSGRLGGYAKMKAALKAGDPPDLAQVEYQEIPSFLIEQGLEELTVHGAAEHRNKFVGWQWEQGVFSDGVYAIPQASGPMATFYRADLFDQWGLEPPETWEDFEKAAAEIRGRDAYISTFPPANSAWFTGMAWQAGARWFGAEDDKWTVDIDNAETRKVADYWHRLVSEDLVKTEPDVANAWYKDLQTGGIVAWVGPQWGDALLRGNAPDTAGSWRVAPMPQWEDAETFSSANWGGSSTALFKGGDYPQDALDFAIWLNTDPESVDLLIEGGYGWPAVADALEGSALDREDPFFGDQRYNEVFAEADAAIDTGWRWTPTTASLYEHLNNGFQTAVEGRGTFADAVADAQTKVIDDLEAKGLPVKAG